MPNSKSSDSYVLRIFIWLYSAGMLYQLYGFHHIANVLASCSWINPNIGTSANSLHFLLLALIVLSAFAENSFRYIWLLTALVYFVIFRNFVICQDVRGSTLVASNHAMPFWVFFTLGLSPLLSASRIVFLLRFFLIFSYFAGGIAKARHGLDWMNGYTLQFEFLTRHMFLNLPLAVWLVSDLFWAKVISWIVVLAELSVPMVLLSKKIEYFYAVCFFIFQIICWIILDLKFMSYYGWIYLIYPAIFLNKALALRDCKE